MKSQYEDRTRVSLPRRTYTILRIDGKAFHTYTRGAEKPFDHTLMEDLDYAAVQLCGSMMGVRFAYGQSDEYSFLMTDFETENTEAWFDGNVQKIASVAASTFGIEFARCRFMRNDWRGCAFDARVFTIPDRVEVENYFIWRQQDATRNAIQMVGQANFSPRQMHGLNVNAIQEKLFSEKGINFNDYPANAKRGRVVFKESYDHESDGVVTERNRWTVDQDMPILTQCREYFRTRMCVPEYPR